MLATLTVGIALLTAFSSLAGGIWAGASPGASWPWSGHAMALHACTLLCLFSVVFLLGGQNYQGALWTAVFLAACSMSGWVLFFKK